MAKGGNRPGSGRPKGRKNGVKVAVDAAVARAEKMLGSGMSPLEYMLSVMKDDQGDPEMRLEAAKAAAPYVHRKQPQAVEVEKTHPMEAVEFFVIGDVTAPKGD